jgi:hypothetical protein
MPNTNTRWYRLLTTLELGQASNAFVEHVLEHLAATPNVVGRSFIPTIGVTGSRFIQIIVTVIMNGSKSSDDAAMFTLADHLVTVHGYSGLLVTVVTSDLVYP